MYRQIYSFMSINEEIFIARCVTVSGIAHLYN